MDNLEDKEDILAKFNLDKGKLTSIKFAQLWKHYDKDKTGFLERIELEGFCRDLLSIGKDPSCVDSDEVQAMCTAILMEYDDNRDGTLSMGELSRLLPVEENFLCRYQLGELTMEDFEEIFKHYDATNDGVIEEEELDALMRDLALRYGHGEDEDASVVDQFKSKILSLVDKNADGKIQKEELRLLLSNPKKKK